MLKLILIQSDEWLLYSFHLLFIISKQIWLKIICKERVYLCMNRVKNKKYHTARAVLKSNKKIIETGKIDTSYTHMYDYSISWINSTGKFNTKWQR